MKASAEIWITAKVAAPFLRCDPNALRDKIRNNPDDVGYKVQTNKLTADSYDKEQGFLVGGSKTEAGKNRTVTISPKIKKYIDRAALSPGVLFCNDEGKAWTLEQFTDYVFYPTLESIGIENPMVEIAGGKKRHKYTPHTCRHTFATLLKRINGSDKDKQELIGHASPEMLRYYQDVELDDLRRITDAL